MKETFTIFKKFSNKEQAVELKNLLKEAGINSSLGDNVASFDHTFSGNTMQNQFEVKIKQADFEKAEKVLLNSAEILMDQMPNDYYLFSFSDDELFDILKKYDEWNEFDYKLAQKLLKQRGKPMDENLLQELKQKRIQALSKPDGNQLPWIIAGYICALFGGLLGIAIGLSIMNSQKTLPTGKKIYSHSESDREHGKIILYIGIPVFLIYCFNKVFND